MQYDPEHLKQLLSFIERIYNDKDCGAIHVPESEGLLIAPFCAKIIIGIASCAAHMLAVYIAAKNENLTFRELRDVIGANSFVYLLHMPILR